MKIIIINIQDVQLPTSFPIFEEWIEIKLLLAN